MRTTALLLLPLALAACPAEEDTDATDTDDTDVADTDVDAEPLGDLVATQAEGDLTVELRADRPLRTGLNEVWFRVLDASGAPIDGLTVTQAPLMRMTDKEHACPYTQPVAAGDGHYAADLVFIMASGDQGTWEDVVTVTGGAATEVTFADLAVADGGLVQMLTVGEEKWVASLSLGDGPTTGENPFVLTVHRKQDALSFPPVDDLTVAVEPFMPDMGHGSQGNVDPTYTADGRYDGTVVFSMAGAWTVTFTLVQGGAEVASVVFDVDV